MNRTMARDIHTIIIIIIWSLVREKRTQKRCRNREREEKGGGGGGR